jgi:hypothetical protein
MIVHSALPAALTRAVDALLQAAGVAHVAHGDGDPVRSASQAAGDPTSVALIGPYRSAAVAEAVEATAPVGLPLLAPMATWAGVTRDDEPGCEDAAQHRGTVLRLIARDTVVAARVSADVEAASGRAFVVAGDHEYGRQLDGQLRLANLPRTDDPSAADLVVFAGLADDSEIGRSEALSRLPVIAFDGVQGAQLGDGRDWRLALPIAPVEGTTRDDLFAGVDHARRAAQLVVTAMRDGATDRASLLAAVRALGPFDGHGDPVDPPVWLWRVLEDWTLLPDRALA